MATAYYIGVASYVTEPHVPLIYELTTIPGITPSMTINSSTGVIDWTPAFSGGPEQVTVKVTDNLGGFSSKSFFIRIDNSDLTISTTTLPYLILKRAKKTNP